MPNPEWIAQQKYLMQVAAEWLEVEREKWRGGDVEDAIAMLQAMIRHEMGPAQETGER